MRCRSPLRNRCRSENEDLGRSTRDETGLSSEALAAEGTKAEAIVEDFATQRYCSKSFATRVLFLNGLLSKKVTVAN